jgi:hypothetical protein
LSGHASVTPRAIGLADILGCRSTHVLPRTVGPALASQSQGGTAFPACRRRRTASAHPSPHQYLRINSLALSATAGFFFSSSLDGSGAAQPHRSAPKEAGLQLVAHTTSPTPPKAPRMRAPRQEGRVCACASFTRPILPNSRRNDASHWKVAPRGVLDC